MAEIDWDALDEQVPALIQEALGRGRGGAQWGMEKLSDLMTRLAPHPFWEQARDLDFDSMAERQQERFRRALQTEPPESPLRSFFVNDHEGDLELYASDGLCYQLQTEEDASEDDEDEGTPWWELFENVEEYWLSEEDPVSFAYQFPNADLSEQLRPFGELLNKFIEQEVPDLDEEEIEDEDYVPTALDAAYHWGMSACGALVTGEALFRLKREEVLPPEGRASLVMGCLECGDALHLADLTESGWVEPELLPGGEDEGDYEEVDAEDEEQ